MPHGKGLYEVEKGQIGYFRAADESYTFIANLLHRSKGCLQDFLTNETVMWHKKMKLSS